MKHNVLVYGSLRNGKHNHGMLYGSKFLEEGTVDGFSMFSLGSFPFITPSEGTIVVEAYEVDDDTFERLDRLEGYPNFYNRKDVVMSTGLRGWIYYMDSKYREGAPHVTSGDWMMA